jgi:hypothetical protein
MGNRRFGRRPSRAGGATNTAIKDCSIPPGNIQPRISVYPPPSRAGFQTCYRVGGWFESTGAARNRSRVAGVRIAHQLRARVASQPVKASRRGQGTVEYALILMLVSIMVGVVLLTVGQQTGNVSSNLVVRVEGDVPGWVTVASTIGAALAGGLIGLLAPFVTQWLQSRQASKRAADDEQKALKAVMGELNDNQGILSILAMGLPPPTPAELTDRMFQTKRPLLAERLPDGEFGDLAVWYAELLACKRDIDNGAIDKDRCRVLSTRTQGRIVVLRNLVRR